MFVFGTPYIGEICHHRCQSVTWDPFQQYSKFSCEMELEAKLDEDYLFYLGFVDTFLRRISDQQTQAKAKLWLSRLLAGSYQGVERKRCRNVYLSRLLVCMQNGVVDGPFDVDPHTVDITKAGRVFGPVPSSIEPPEWLNESRFDASDELHHQRAGRTYVATRTLPGGQGAFAYVGVSLADEEPMWLGAGEAPPEFGQTEPPKRPARDDELEKILARRREPKDREKVLAFYDVLLQTIADELDGKDVAENETVEGLLVQLIHDLDEKGEYERYEALGERDRRDELLLALFERVRVRRDKVATREEILDDLEQMVIPRSFFDVSEVLPEDKYYYPAAMWEQAIDKHPEAEQMEALQRTYPLPVVQKFLECLASHKETIAVRMQRRHENIASQMKKEMRKEGEKLRKASEEAEHGLANTLEVLDAVAAHYEKVQEAIRTNKRVGDGEESEHSQLYEAMRRAVFDQQKLVEEEALRGKVLAHQINAVNEQNEQFHHVNDDVIKKAEEANMKTMKNIRNLRAAIKRYDAMLAEMRLAAENQRKSAKMVYFF